jgi:hypothetical protein
MISIGITTFKRRIEMVSAMVSQIREWSSDVPINLAINGEVIDDFDENYRLRILDLCSIYPKMYPCFYQEFRSLARLWNNLVINSVTEYNLILNDDLRFNPDDSLIEAVNTVIANNDGVKMFTINGSFAHFVITKSLLDDVNYFDERFLLHGEEDGDFVWRYIDKYGSYPPAVSCPGILNLEEDRQIGLKGADIGYANKPRFNQEFTVTKYRFDPNGKISGMYGRPHVKVIGDEKQYPYESFFFKNKGNLGNFENIKL